MGKNPDITINTCRTKSQGAKQFKKQQWSWSDGPVGRQIKNLGCNNCVGIRFATDGGWDSLTVSAWKCSWKNDKNTDLQFCNSRKSNRDPQKDKSKCEFTN